MFVGDRITIRPIRLFLAIAAILSPVTRIAPAEAQYIYWTERVYDLYGTRPPDELRVIRRSYYDGTDIEEVITPTLVHPTSVAIHPDTGQFYWAESGGKKIGRSSSDGSNAEVLVDDGLTYPSNLRLDAARGKIYWTNGGGYDPDDSHTIQRANLDGSQRETLVNRAIGTERSMDIDPIRAKLYWTNRATIYRINFDGSEQEAAISTPWGFIHEILVAPSAGRIYWKARCSGFNCYSQKLFRANLDGTDITELNSRELLRNLAFDARGQRLYWVEIDDLFYPHRYRVRSADLNGDDVQDLFPINNLPLAFFVDPTAERLHWIDDDTREVHRANFDGTADEKVLPPIHQAPSSVAVDPDVVTLCWIDGALRSLECSDLEGRGDHRILQTPESIPGVLALDPVEQRIYWTARAASSNDWTIRRTDETGTAAEDIVTTDLADPRGIAIDASHRKLYWADYAAGKIRRSDLDGGHAEIVTIASRPWGVDVDERSQRLYWSSDGYGVVGANIDGSNPETVWYRDPIQEFVFDDHARRYYGIDPTLYTIFRTDPEIRAKQVLVSGMEEPRGLALIPPPFLASSDPPFCAIDARQPHLLNDRRVAFGWGTLDIRFSEPMPALTVNDFSVRVRPNYGLRSIAKVERLAPDAFRVFFDYRISPGNWTCVRHVFSGSEACVGYLPGDVDGSGKTNHADIPNIIDCLNRPSTCALHQCDLDRSGVCNARDVARMIDLLQGAGEFNPWIIPFLDQCPSK